MTQLNFLEKMKAEKISELTTNRLSVYLRCLNQLAAENIKTVSSENLAQRYHLNSAQIRKDLAYFGEFGVRGVGYYVEDLRKTLIKILGLDTEHRVGIVGAGRLGTALADYYGFKQSNFNVVALFDTNTEKIGQQIGKAQVPVYSFNNFAEAVKNENIDVVVIAVPADFAQEVFDEIARAGIKAVLNFAPSSLQTHNEIKLKTVDLTISLESLSYFLAHPSNSENSIETNKKILQPKHPLPHKKQSKQRKENSKL
jgi:redox-sensing transcriptional repressor